MQASTYSSSARCVLLLLLAIGVTEGNARAADLPIRVDGPSRELAFARYVARNAQRDPFAKCGPVAVLIQASLPDLYKEAAVLGLRTQEGNGQSELQIAQITGDGTVLEEVIDRYFALRQEYDLLPRSLITITPANYKFRFAGEAKAGGTAAYIYDITPKEKRPGTVIGQLWLDSSTGQEVMLSGHLTNVPGAGGRVDMVRDTKLMNGLAFSRATHLTFTIPHLGKAEVAITEIVLSTGIVPRVE